MSTYRDIDMLFTKTNESDIKVLTDIETINQSIHNLVLTKHGAFNRFQLSQYGSNVAYLIGESNTEFVAIQIKDEVENGIRNFENRIELISIDHITSNERGTFVLKIVYQVIKTRITTEFSIELDVIL